MVPATRFRLSGLILIGLLGASGCSTPGGPTSEVNPRIPETASSAVLRSGDSLTVTLQGVPDPSVNTVQIGEQGVITLPYIGNVTAAGVSTGDLSQRIRDTYIGRNIYTTVDVSVSVTERYVYVGGEVGHPGRIVWTPDLTASKAVQAAGGFSLYAKQTAVNLVRDKTSFSVDIKLAQKEPSQDPRLMPGDSLQVERSPF
jgi:protein involved in polysaccharide export with SLBB domain